ncbi:NUDIX hydrolase [Candidatus Uhrbacteria bacterium]|jgi:8-oxo-dGTP pyrophosphatase MutT (NUDIX family)|nr:NUDIX hydrolase [Candidatus Uhrbacteria bacterium]
MPEMLTAFIANKGLLVRPDGKCLFMRDSGKMPGHAGTAGLWDMPGGRMDIGETDMVKTLARELSEEVGYELPEGSTPEVFSIMTWKNMSDLWICGHFYRIDVDQRFSPTLSDEHDEFIWEFPHKMINKTDSSNAFSCVWKEYIDKYSPDVWQEISSQSSTPVSKDEPVLG